MSGLGLHVHYVRVWRMCGTCSPFIVSLSSAYV